MDGSLVFLTPLGGLAAVAAAAPLAGAVVAERRVRRARTQLGLAGAQPGRRLPRLLALAAVPALLGVAATQPVIRSTTSARVRADAEAFFVIDVSRSMKASKGPAAPTRFARAVEDAIALRAAIPMIPSGIATLTDRVLPSLFPNPDATVFDDTITHAVAIEQPPPENENVVATSLAALGALGTQNYFAPAAKRRLVVVLTDGESRPFDVGPVAHALASGPGVHLVLVHVWARGRLSTTVGGSNRDTVRIRTASKQWPHWPRRAEVPGSASARSGTRSEQRRPTSAPARRSCRGGASDSGRSRRTLSCSRFCLCSLPSVLPAPEE